MGEKRWIAAPQQDGRGKTGGFPFMQKFFNVKNFIFCVYFLTLYIELKYNGDMVICAKTARSYRRNQKMKRAKKWLVGIFAALSLSCMGE
jgi:hypothetical protein